MNSSTNSSDASGVAPQGEAVDGGAVDGGAIDGGAIDGDDSHGDAVSGATSDEDGVPTPTGSIPPGPGTPDADETTDATALPPLKERMY